MTCVLSLTRFLLHAHHDEHLWYRHGPAGGEADAERSLQHPGARCPLQGDAGPGRSSLQPGVEESSGKHSQIKPKYNSMDPTLTSSIEDIELRYIMY